MSRNMSRLNKGYKQRYIHKFLNMKCSVDMMLNRIFPNAKEITESFAAYEAAKLLNISFSEEYNAVCVGDGATPRTASTFAYRTKWNCFSIDPALKNRSYNIQRLTILPKKVQEISLDFISPVLILAVHSHAPLMECLKTIRAPKISIIAMPCCVDLSIPNQKPDYEYRDENVWSPENLIKVWKDVKVI